MNEKQWERSAQALAEEHATRISHAYAAEIAVLGLACPTPAQLRQALVELDRLLRSAPTPGFDPSPDGSAVRLFAI